MKKARCLEMARCALVGIISALFFFTYSINAAAGSQGSAKNKETVDRIVAVVNNDIITLYELNRILDPYIKQIKANGYSQDKEHEMLYNVRSRMLDNLINKKLTDQQTKRYNLTIGEEEVDKTIERMKASQFQTDEDLRDELEKQGLTMEEYRNLVKEQILRNRLVNYEVKSKIVITNEDVKTYYQENIDKYRGADRVRLRNIVLRTSPSDGEAEREGVKERLEKILTQIRAGESFAELAKTHSESSSAGDGGDLGFFEVADLSRSIREAIKDLKAGEVTAVMETPQGYQLFYVAERKRNPGKSLADATPEIRETLYNEIVNKAFKSWLEGLRKEAHVKIIN